MSEAENSELASLNATRETALMLAIKPVAKAIRLNVLDIRLLLNHSFSGKNDRENIPLFSESNECRSRADVN